LNFIQVLGVSATSFRRNTVDAVGGTTKEIVAFAGTGRVSNSFESVPEYDERARWPIDGKVALKHAAICAEEFDAIREICMPSSGEIFGCRRRWLLMPIETGGFHGHTSELYRYIWASGEPRD